ncbi:uroporphyrinogen-III synthase [Veronia pacifica]|uniref:Uroporphyrinogen-III synthase n=1 Tax=Veronia pacifica TaxID=1080227 RepID=A0A1C3EJL6_9GAMM|nr:uroporphyrinogen-III synthase [Veronia pacifica]ODA33418.1 hypothetical protein A8L45_10225 [Veronia pacifica]
MTIAVVRPAPESEALVKELEKAGLSALSAPMLTFTSGDALPILTKTLNRLPADSIVIVISRRAVEFSCQQLQKDKAEWRDDLTYIAVGERTASYWEELADVSAHTPLREDSEGLLTLPQLQHPDGKDIVILRADTGRELLSQTLQQRGANVCYLAVYRRNWSDEQYLSALDEWAAAQVDTLVVSSGEQLTLLFKGVSDNHRHWLQRCHILVPSRRVYNLAKEIGFSKVTNVEGASNAQFYSALVNMHNPGNSDDRQ